MPVKHISKYLTIEKQNKIFCFTWKNKKTIIKLSSNTKKNIRKGIKRANYLYKNNIIKFNQYFSSIECFKNNYIFVNKDKVNHFIDRYNG